MLQAGYTIAVDRLRTYFIAEDTVSVDSLQTYFMLKTLLL